MTDLRKTATGHGWEKIPNEARVAMLAADAEITRLRAKVAKADALAEALESSGNVTERHCRALHALIAYREADT